jgi:cyclic pyranopterin phosphate synthase
MNDVLKQWRDGIGRRIDYIRVSVTDRCDMRCAYCMPEGFRDFEEPAHWLSFAELMRLLRIFSSGGLRRVRLTGGEPLLRARLAELASGIKSLRGIEDLSISTNGSQLSKRANALKAAGVDRLNISLDTLDRSRFEQLTKRDALPDVLQGLEHARSLRFKAIKINMVWLPDSSEDDLDRMIAYCRERGFVLRLIETMPLGVSARNSGYASLQAIIANVKRHYSLLDGVVPGGGPARYLSSADGQFSIGFITPLSQHFCDSCNRVRLTVDGSLHLCLGQEDRLDLRSMLRGGADDPDIIAAIQAALNHKPSRHHFNESPLKLVRPMSKTGG